MSLINKLYVKLFCQQVGGDHFGNVYYQSKKENHLGQKKRYVVYQGVADGSKIPALWHGWLHYTINEMPSKSVDQSYEWQIEHRRNLTGSKYAYSPTGDQHIAANMHYKKWTP